jgi:hypothetical protein
VQLSPEQRHALDEARMGAMTSGQVPEDFATIASPQPATLHPRQVLVAASWGSCRDTPGRVLWKHGVLAVEIVRPSSRGASCLGSVETAGLVVSLPDRAVVSRVRTVRPTPGR